MSEQHQQQQEAQDKSARDAGKILRRERQRAGFTLSGVAERIQIGSVFLSDCERGKRRLRPEWTLALCVLYGVTPEVRRELIRIGIRGTGWPVEELLEQPAAPQGPGATKTVTFVTSHGDGSVKTVVARG
jgi:transcriptional regulator with XRE-family HTH domain